MGKKHVVKPTQEQLLQERAVVEETIEKGNDIKSSRGSQKANIFIKLSYNNTLLTVTDDNGNVMTWASSGSIGFKGTKKGTPFAATKTAQAIADRLKKANIKNISIYLKGIGPGRDATLRAFGAQTFVIDEIVDTTSAPHNGCRKPKPRRV